MNNNSYYQKNKDEINRKARERYKLRGRKPQISSERKEYQKRYREIHRQELSSKQKIYIEKNKEYKYKQQLEYRKKNREKINLRMRKYLQNADVQRTRKEYIKNYWDSNRKVLNEKRKNKYASDLTYKLRMNLRGRLNAAIKNKCKIGSAVNDLGCSIKEFIKYIERLFVDGMNWNNRGKWHLDHIIPLCQFNLENRNEFLKACHYSNIQPLWANDNLRKGGNT